MSWDWRTFCEVNGIIYTEGGASSAKDNIYVDCPFCGIDGQGKGYMGLSTMTSSWGCWKLSAHRGHRPVRIIKALLRLDWAKAEELFNEGGGKLREVSAIRARLEAKPDQGLVNVRKLKLPDDFYFALDERRGERIVDFVAKRRFAQDDVEEVIRDFDIHGGDDPRWRYRAILPFYDIDDRLVGWTGRATQKATLRYLTEPEGEQAQHVVFNAGPASEGGKLLVLVEGPVDAAKLDFYGAPFGVRSVGLLGLALTAGKMRAVMDLAPRFDKIVVMLDQGALRQALAVRSEMACLGVGTKMTPFGAEDAGDLYPDQVREWCEDQAAKSF